MQDKVLIMKSLIEKLNKASDAYYGGYVEIMSDYEWNESFDELIKLENETGIILPNSPTHNVSTSTNSFAKTKEKHEFPALSLPKSKSISDVVKWANGKPIDLSWKLDGCTLVVTYDDGVLQKVVTRGDGYEGDDVTLLSDVIYNIQKNISYKGHIVIRGECVISYSNFEKYNKNHNNEYENPRNLVAGSLNPKIDINIIKERCLTWIPFTLVYYEDDNDNHISWKNRMHLLQKLGFATVEFEYIGNTNDIQSKIEEWSQDDRVDTIIYPVDGLVVVYDDTEYASHGDLTGHHDTRGGYAFKWKDEEAVTVLDHIEWSVSINSINPVAVFSPVKLEGTTVKRASLCNISECKRLGIGDKGTELTVIKANKIIPKIVSAVKHGDFILPDRCPVCGGSIRIDTSANGVEILKCDNTNCIAKHISKLSRFVSKYGFNIQGLSEKTLMELVDKNLIRNFVDIITLPERVDKVTSILGDSVGWGEKSLNNLINSVKYARSNVKADNFLYALCIPMCGRDVSKILTSKYTLHDIFDKAKSKSADLLNLDDIGDVKSSEIFNWFSVDSNYAMACDIMSKCNIIDNNNLLNSDDIFADYTFVITGSLINYKSRDILKSEIESFGGKVAGGVSKNTTYLINNDIDSNSSKNKKAKELGIPIITEMQYIDLKNRLKIQH